MWKELVRRQSLALAAIPQAPVYTKAMKAGEESPRKARKTDIKFYVPLWTNCASVRFIWECKLVGDSRVDGKCKGLVAEYIGHGMLRFLDGAYPADHDDAGMLGYVLAGDVPDIVRDINRSMKTSRRGRRLDDSDDLVSAAAIGDFEDVYCSHHVRSSGQAVRLHHLFLTFEFN